FCPSYSSLALGSPSESRFALLLQLLEPLLRGLSHFGHLPPQARVFGAGGLAATVQHAELVGQLIHLGQGAGEVFVEGLEREGFRPLFRLLAPRLLLLVPEFGTLRAVSRRADQEAAVAEVGLPVL